MQFSKEQLSTLREQLPRGAAKKLAEMHFLEPGSVRNILSGLSNNEAVILSAVEMAREYQEKLANAKNSLTVSA